MIKLWGGRSRRAVSSKPAAKKLNKHKKSTLENKMQEKEGLRRSEGNVIDFETLLHMVNEHKRFSQEEREREMALKRREYEQEYTLDVAVGGVPIVYGDDSGVTTYAMKNNSLKFIMQ